MADFKIESMGLLALLLGCGIFYVEKDVDFEPIPVWAEGEDGKKHPTNRQAVDTAGTPLWRLPLRAKVLRFGRVTRVDASVTVPSVATLHVADIPSVADAARLMTGAAPAKRGFPTPDAKED